MYLNFNNDNNFITVYNDDETIKYNFVSIINSKLNVLKYDFLTDETIYFNEDNIDSKINKVNKKIENSKNSSIYFKKLESLIELKNDLSLLKTMVNI